MLIYLDASALLRFLRRAESGVAPLRDGDVVVSSDLLELELRRALERAFIAKKIDQSELESKLDEAIALVDTFHLFPVADEVIGFARPRLPFELGVMGSIHVATAQLVQRDAGQPLQFWTHVEAVASAAALRGLDARGSTARG